MSRQPFEWYVERYNMVGTSRKKAAFRFSKESWESLMQYRQWETDDAVKAALERPKVALLKEVSRDDRELLCLDCREMSWIGGAAMTNYECQSCKRSTLFGMTNTPRLCGYCAFTQFKCMRCAESRDKDL